MATFRIHTDRENRDVNDIRQKQFAPVQQKRNALSALENHSSRANQLKGKQPLGLNIHDVSLKLNLNRNIPVVPVAQFEAFNVYEDLKENAKPIQLKKDWFVQEPKALLQLPKEVIEITKTEEVVVESLKRPMSIEKVTSTPQQTLKYLISPKSKEELFFENVEYRNDIYAYLRKIETVNRPKSGYMHKQPDITYSMRTILVDWLVEVAEEYKLQCETLFLAINYVDRFLSYMSVVRGKLQLVGTAAMYIAAKYEEIYPPEIGEFVYITDDTYTKKQVIRMEHLILKVLSFDLSVPTALTFIKAMCIASDMSEKVSFLSMYLSELAMLEADLYIDILPSVMAASAIAIARYTLNLEPWTTELKSCTGYDLKELKTAMEFLYMMFMKAPSNNQQAIQEKYNSVKYLYVSQLVPRHERILIDK